MSPPEPTKARGTHGWVHAGLARPAWGLRYPDSTNPGSGDLVRKTSSPWFVSDALSHGSMNPVVALCPWRVLKPLCRALTWRGLTS
ncbi:hypothetical protein CRG98_024944 [Punica granatum]|uniref:Uncharacterized protein n=1 Tax=Punica granatum TaxID=22663 RepID=A0A2I0JEK5_PUNGR|nr:hypothetical protein CRG98_024944 [Punica granatum]